MQYLAILLLAGCSLQGSVEKNLNPKYEVGQCYQNSYGRALMVEEIQQFGMTYHFNLLENGNMKTDKWEHPHSYILFDDANGDWTRRDCVN